MPTSATSRELYIGLMSGTSLDSIDAALVDLNNNRCQLINAVNFAIPTALQAELISLCSPGSNEIDRLGAADRALGRVFSDAVNALISASQISAHQIRAIGSHGQTIRHRPNLEENKFSLQIGDPNTIAEGTGITTVADFRRRDIAAGGQGAPLAPAFHRAVFSSTSHPRAIVNIGGMANITLLGKATSTIGFDTGPGNILMDCWTQLHLNKPYDRNGEWAAIGNPIQRLLEQMLEHEYFHRPIPKSTGREEFNLKWLQSHPETASHSPEHVQSTLLELTATSIANAIINLAEPIPEVYVCGGGAYNTQLMARLGELLRPTTVQSTEPLGIAPEWVEAAAFAWLAKQTLDGLTGNLPSVTGADREVILGGVYPGNH